MSYIKHRFNIFPEMASDEYERLKSDLLEKGYNDKLPITIYQDGVLDGWNRYRACEELNIPPRLEFFKGTEDEAMGFVMQSNKRRNITKSQWAAIAVESEDILESLRAEARERMMAGKSNPLLPEHKGSDKTHTNEKLAELFDTSTSYITEAQKIKKESPEDFEKVKRGEKSFATTRRERKRNEEQGEPNEDLQEESTPGTNPEKDRLFKLSNDLIKQINEMPVIYRLKIKQSIRT